MENKTKKYLKFQVKTTLRHKEDKQRKNVQNCKDQKWKLHKNIEIKK